MNNYEYIIAGLPVLRQGENEKMDAAAILEDIRSQLSPQDKAAVDFLTDGWDDEKLNEAFYSKAASSGKRFIREYFDFDLHVRNTKLVWLNRKLGRPEEQDMMPCPDEEFDAAAEIRQILENPDILARERGLDDAMWKKIDEITIMNVFDLDLILGFVAKLKITDRWMKLDEETGRGLFRKLISEIKDKYDNGNDR